MAERIPAHVCGSRSVREADVNSDVANLGRAQALAAQKRYGEAVSTVLKGRMVRTSNDFYRLSCFYAGNGDKEKALATLQKSFDLGYRNFPAINANPASRDYSRIVGNP
jgi:hypothetical protein